MNRIANTTGATADKARAAVTRNENQNGEMGISILLFPLG